MGVGNIKIPVNTHTASMRSRQSRLYRRSPITFSSLMPPNYGRDGTSFGVNSPNSEIFGVYNNDVVISVAAHSLGRTPSGSQGWATVRRYNRR